MLGSEHKVLSSTTDPFAQWQLAIPCSGSALLLHS